VRELGLEDQPAGRLVGAAQQGDCLRICAAGPILRSGPRGFVVYGGVTPWIERDPLRSHVGRHPDESWILRRTPVCAAASTGCSCQHLLLSNHRA